MQLKNRWHAALAVCALGASVAACGGNSSSKSDSASSGSNESTSACKPAAAGQKVTLTYTSWVPGFDKTVALWNSKNPNIQVKYKSVPAGPQGTYANYTNQLKAGTADDMGFIDYGSLASFRVQDGLADLGACPEVKAAQSKFVPWTWNMVSFGQQGSAFGIPQDQGPMALYYRKDLFEKAGIAVPKTWDAYYAAAKTIKSKGGYITNLSNTSAQWFEGLVWQNGAKWFGLEGNSWTVDFSDPKSTQVADYWQKMIDEDLVTKFADFGDEENKAWNTDKLWSQVGAPWTAQYIETGAPKTKGDWAVAPLPQWTEGTTAAGNWGGSAIAFFKGTKHPAEAAKFAIWANSDPEALALNNENGGQYPNTTTATEDVPALTKGLDFFGGQNIWQEFATASKGVSAVWRWGPTMVATEAELNNGIGAALNQQGTIADAFKNAQAKTIEAMKAQAIEVKG